MVETATGLTASQVQTLIRPTQQTASPLTGATVVVTETAVDTDLWLTPAGPIAALTVTLPNGFIGQRVTIASSQPITVLTVNGAVSIFNPLTTLSIGDAFEMLRIGTTVWVHPT